MKTFLIPCIFASVLLLNACRSTAPESTTSTGAQTEATATHYSCDDGSVVEAKYPTPNTAQVVYKNQSIEMKQVVSASGARYTGGGWQWWTKGSTEGWISPLQPGEEISSAAGIPCTAKPAQEK
ncbi:MAG: MliC family protein [Bryobacterales bacterium]|nr:MliC family protein [Bryobacterales bacterium]